MLLLLFCLYSIKHAWNNEAGIFNRRHDQKNLLASKPSVAVKLKPFHDFVKSRLAKTFTRDLANGINLMIAKKKFVE